MTLCTYHAIIAFCLSLILATEARIEQDFDSREFAPQYDKPLNAKERPIFRDTKQEKMAVLVARLNGKRGEDDTKADTFRGWARGFGKRNNKQQEQFNVFYCIITGCKKYPRTWRIENEVETNRQQDLKEDFPGKFALSEQEED
ncbi:uncharacterized protein [Euwallacea fornicatus]|uniref:uncharacterized protein n=1 Tax=Euwallacea fornicatus TaxID=995702 RepID=UPI00338FC7CA